jgi:hypothetical protein
MKVEHADIAAATAGPRAWAGLSPGTSAQAACQQWLEQFAHEGPVPVRCLVLLRAENRELRLAAVQPAATAVQDLLPLLSQGAAAARAQCLPTGSGWLVTQHRLWAEEERGLVAA